MKALDKLAFAFAKLNHRIVWFLATIIEIERLLSGILHPIWQWDSVDLWGGLQQIQPGSSLRIRNLFVIQPEPLGYDPSNLPVWDSPTSVTYAIFRQEPWRSRADGTGDEVLNWYKWSRYPHSGLRTRMLSRLWSWLVLKNIGVSWMKVKIRTLRISPHHIRQASSWWHGWIIRSLVRVPLCLGQNKLWKLSGCPSSSVCADRALVVGCLANSVGGLISVVTSALYWKQLQHGRVRFRFTGRVVFK